MLLGKVKLESNTAYCGLLLILGILFYVINMLTPLFSDDWHYGFMWGTSTHIQSVSDVLISQYAHYFENNGRFVPHFLMQYFDGILGKSAFNIANTLMFVLLLHMLNVNFVKDRNMYFKSTSITAFSILVISCGFRNAFLWMSGAFNYLWGFSFLLVFNYLFGKNTKKKIIYPLLFLVGVFCGWTNEAYIAGYCCCMLFYVYKNRTSIQPNQIFLLCGLILGACFLCLSPGSIHRAGVSNESFSPTSFMWKLALNLSQMTNMRLFFIALVLLIIKKECRTPWAVAMLTSFCFVLLTGHASGHSRFGIEMFALIIMLSAINLGKIQKWMAIFLTGISFIVLTSSIPFCLHNYNAFKDMEKEVAMSSDGIIPLEITSTPIILDRFVLHYDNYEEGTGFDKSDGFNTNVARYYGVEPLTFLQSELLNDIRSGKEFTDFEYPSSYLYYVREWNKDDNIRSVKFILCPSGLSSYPIFNRMERFSLNELPVNRFCLVDIDDKTFMIVAKNKAVDDRVVNIEVEE